MTSTPLWVSQKQAYEDALYYMKGRMEGSITSIKTPWNKFNQALVDGYEWNSINIIAGRPASGKTLIAEQICREAHLLNPNTEMRILKFQFEMLGRTQAIREYSALLSKSYKHLASADGSQLSKEELEACYNYSKLKVKESIDTVDDPQTTVDMLNIVDKYCNTYPDKKVLLTLDHTVLVKKMNFQRETLDMLYDLGQMLNYTKKHYPVSWIVLSQLGRGTEDPKRNENGSIGNYINDTDIFGADAMLQYADTLVAINRPGKKNITYYGPDRYFIQDVNTLVFHFLKNRGGESCISFFKAEFDKMRIAEMSTPANKNLSIP
jgi:replicative DNA helicase